MFHFLKFRRNIFWRGGPFLFLCLSFGIYFLSKYILRETLSRSGGANPNFLYENERAINALGLFCLFLTLIPFFLQLLSKSSTNQKDARASAPKKT